MPRDHLADRTRRSRRATPACAPDRARRRSGARECFRATGGAGPPCPAAAATSCAGDAPPRTPAAGRADSAASRRAASLGAERVDELDLLGARSLAAAGGVVTVLGIVFFFELAANRGWIGLTELYAAVAAAGAGIAAGYMTLLAATALYDRLSEPVALGCAVAIAIVATSPVLGWRSELVAAIGLLGALASARAVCSSSGSHTGASLRVMWSLSRSRTCRSSMRHHGRARGSCASGIELGSLRRRRRPRAARAALTRVPSPVRRQSAGNPPAQRRNAAHGARARVRPPTGGGRGIRPGIVALYEGPPPCSRSQPGSSRRRWGLSAVWPCSPRVSSGDGLGCGTRGPESFGLSLAKVFSSTSITPGRRAEGRPAQGRPPPGRPATTSGASSPALAARSRAAA